VKGDVATLHTENPNQPIPADLVTTSGSGLDPDVTPAGTFFQVPRIARVRGLSEDRVRALVESHIQNQQWGFLGEPRVNVLALNLPLDQEAAK
jgi:K+-transporting ATPase ATPase C chain